MPGSEARGRGGRNTPALLELRGVAKSYTTRRGPLGLSTRSLQALSDLDLEVREGECLALVGESGSGKSTLAKVMLRLLTADKGRILFAGEDLSSLSAKNLRRRRGDFQLVFQDAAAALDPRLTVGESITEPLLSFTALGRQSGAKGSLARRERVAELLEQVGLNASHAERYPHQLSGGQRQRVTIARALASEPRLLILDEPVSALDVSVQARILETLRELQSKFGLTLVFITHDLSVVEQIADRVGVLYLGRLVELGDRRDLLSRPRHPYTASLLASVPVPDPERPRSWDITLDGELPSAFEPPPGCPFHPRCVLARDHCSVERPRLRQPPLEPGPQAEDNEADRSKPQGTTSVVPTEWLVACHYPGELLPKGTSPSNKGSGEGFRKIG